MKIFLKYCLRPFCLRLNVVIAWVSLIFQLTLLQCVHEGPFPLCIPLCSLIHLQCINSLFVARRHQAITSTNVDKSSVRFCGIHLRAVSQKMSKISMLDIYKFKNYYFEGNYLKIMFLMSMSLFPGAIELTHQRCFSNRLTLLIGIVQSSKTTILLFLIRQSSTKPWISSALSKS